MAVSGAWAEASRDRAFNQALIQYRAGRYSDAFGRLLPLASGGDADAARIVLFMHHFGPSLYGSYWDLNPQEIAAFTQLAASQTRHKEASFTPSWQATHKPAVGRRAPTRESGPH